LRYVNLAVITTQAIAEAGGNMQFTFIILIFFNCLRETRSQHDRLFSSITSALCYVTVTTLRSDSVNNEELIVLLLNDLH
jgi:hypothetical protein